MVSVVEAPEVASRLMLTWPAEPSPAGLCSDSCDHAADGDCDDGDANDENEDDDDDEESNNDDDCQGDDCDVPIRWV